MDVISDNIRYIRMMRGLSQKELGDRVNKSANAVSNWEKGTTSPDVETLDKVCKVLHVDPNQMFGWDPCPELEKWLNDQQTMVNDMDELIRQRTELDTRIKAYSQQLIAKHLIPKK